MIVNHGPPAHGGVSTLMHVGELDQALEGIDASQAIQLLIGWGAPAMWANGYIAKRPRVQKVGMILSILTFAGGMVIGVIGASSRR